MVQKILFIPLIISFLATLIALPHWINRAKHAGLVGKDMHKSDKREVAEIGGIPVLFGFLLGLLSYIALSTFYFKNIRVNHNYLIKQIKSWFEIFTITNSRYVSCF